MELLVNLFLGFFAYLRLAFLFLLCIMTVEADIMGIADFTEMVAGMTNQNFTEGGCVRNDACVGSSIGGFSGGSGGGGCACAGSGRAGCSRKDFYKTNITTKKIQKAIEEKREGKTK